MRHACLRSILGSIAAIFALAISSVAACACNHHASKAIRSQPSCHAAATHEPPIAEETPTDNDRVEKDCNCTIRVSLASVLARSESNRSGHQERPAAVIGAVALPEPTSIETSAVILAAAIKPNLYQKLDHPRAPSRAPPRL
jgi:hypothetical protein